MNRVYQDLLKAYLTQDNISREAYFIWERAGRPNGEDVESGIKIRDKHWFSAIGMLEMAAEMDADRLAFCSDIGKQMFADATGG